MPKSGSNLSAVLTEVRLVTDRQTDRQTDTQTERQTQSHRKRKCAKIKTNDTVDFFLKCNQHFGNLKPNNFPSAV